jgi:hypothetical protein
MRLPRSPFKAVLRCGSCTEDLDFTCGSTLNPDVLDGFAGVLTQRIGRNYRLRVEVDVTLSDPSPTIAMGRWRATVSVPASNSAIKQSYALNVEVAAVPSYSRDLLDVNLYFPDLADSYRSLQIPTESLQEIAVDKIVALGACPYLKHRDVWDLSWLHVNHAITAPLTYVDHKIDDSGIDRSDFRASLDRRLDELRSEEYPRMFLDDMHRLLGGHTTMLLEGDMGLCRGMIDRAIRATEGVLGQAGATPPGLPLIPPPELGGQSQ